MDNLTLFKLHLNICWVPGMAQTTGTSIVFSVLLEILLLWVWSCVFIPAVPVICWVQV